jgi:hypothetical protein
MRVWVKWENTCLVSMRLRVQTPYTPKGKEKILFGNIRDLEKQKITVNVQARSISLSNKAGEG